MKIYKYEEVGKHISEESIIEYYNGKFVSYLLIRLPFKYYLSWEFWRKDCNDKIDTKRYGISKWYFKGSNRQGVQNG
jgi:hypothetical protein